MSNKAFILAMYLVALFIILKNNYHQSGKAGMPYPTLITAPSYLYAVLGLTADFTGGLSAVLAAGLTLGLFYKTHQGADLSTVIQTGPSGTTATITPKSVPYTIPSATKPGTNP